MNHGDHVIVGSTRVQDLPNFGNRCADHCSHTGDLETSIDCRHAESTVTDARTFTITSSSSDRRSPCRLHRVVEHLMIRPLDLVHARMRAFHENRVSCATHAHLGSLSKFCQNILAPKFSVHVSTHFGILSCFEERCRSRHSSKL